MLRRAFHCHRRIAPLNHLCAVAAFSTIIAIVPSHVYKHIAAIWMRSWIIVSVCLIFHRRRRRKLTRWNHRLMRATVHRCNVRITRWNKGTRIYVINIILFLLMTFIYMVLCMRYKNNVKCFNSRLLRTETMFYNCYSCRLIFVCALMMMCLWNAMQCICFLKLINYTLLR